MKPLSIQELDDRICNYCLDTERGTLAEVHTPNGVTMCEGFACQRAYQTYLEEFEDEEYDEHNESSFIIEDEEYLRYKEYEEEEQERMSVHE